MKDVPNPQSLKLTPPRKWLWFNIAVCFLVSGLGLWALESSNYQNRKQNEYSHTYEDLTELRIQLENIITQNLNLSQGMATYIATNPDISQKEYSAFGAQLLKRKNNIINIGAAKDMVIGMIYPIAGNEKALGLDYRKQQSEAFDAIRAGNTVLSGPLNLVQGGVGLIARQPIYLNQTGETWGLLSTVLDYDAIIKESGLLTAKHLNITLKGRDAKGAQGDFIWGKPEVFEQNPIIQTVKLPFGSWVIAATPKSGWMTFRPSTLIWSVAYIVIFLWLSLIHLRYKTVRREQKSLVNSITSARRFSDLFESHDAVMLLIESQSGRIIDANQSAQNFYGYTQQQLTRMRISDINQASPEKVYEDRQKAAFGEQNAFVMTHRLKNGDIRKVEVHSSPVETGNNTLLFSIIHDITDRFESQKKLTLDAVVFANSQEGIIITDKHRNIISVNKAFEIITGYTAAESLGKNPSFLSAQKQGKEFFIELWNTVNETGQWKGEVWNRRKSGKVFPELLSITEVKDEAGQPEYYVGVFSDITKLKQSEEELENLALTDSLTGLPNRLSLKNTLDHAIAHAKRSHERVAVLFLDLDKFKVVNDSLGHAAGDELLKSVSGRLSERLREKDTLGRLGGDEFVIILENLNSEKDIITVAKDIIELINRPFPLEEGQEAYIGTSIGISQYPDNASKGEDLIAYADVAMYQAKQNGRNTYSFYNESLTADADKQMRTFSQIKRGIKAREFELYYQPQIDIHTGKIIGSEALLRWNHPERGLLTPAHFIRIAEERGVIRDLSRYVLVAACQQLKRWQDMGFKQTLSVNISPQDFNHRDFTREVRHIVQQSHIDPNLLELEITESALMRNADAILNQLQTLRNLGIQLAIDDFGTGYSSLSYLKHFPINKLKIDRSFIQDIEEDSSDRAIVSAIIDMAKNFNLTIVAEGVEKAPQELILQAEGCDLSQGYLHSKPVPAATFTAMLENA
ncbi:MAG: hypothetical protein AseanaTS_30820 [Candidatus Pelagadaptatus aseana]|uniref:bifunctional diguanylate cyclase/phosphodiesterase n=1 Tax=Candidatus Pelagadaptatus aseana TaxID=3120508 RepID=UPI0039B1D7CE